MFNTHGLWSVAIASRMTTSKEFNAMSAIMLFVDKAVSDQVIKLTRSISFNTMSCDRYDFRAIKNFSAVA